MEHWYTVESKSIWTVSHFFGILTLQASTLDLKLNNVHEVKVVSLCFEGFKKCREMNLVKL